MAPIRRYLRITKYSVLEVRVYLDNPALAETWLLNPRDPVLPRVITAVRPFVLPKLREENERVKTKTKGKKAKGVKDTVVEDDFEVSIFLKDVITRHAVLTKSKDFQETGNKLGTTKGKLTGWLNEKASDVNDNDKDEGNSPIEIREESDDERHNLSDFPELDTSRQKRSRPSAAAQPIDVSDDEGFEDDIAPSKKRTKQTDTEDVARADEEQDDKKKLGLNTAYDGFNIYGRVLCLVVKRRNEPGRGHEGGGQQMLEQWVSTQAAQDQTAIMDD